MMVWYWVDLGGESVVKITLVPSMVDSPDTEPYQVLTSFRIDESLALDAGSLGLWGTPSEQARVRNVLVSHTHLDHIASLPVFLENTGPYDSESVSIHGSRATLDCLRRDLFNDRIWPDLEKLSTPTRPFVHLIERPANKKFTLAGLRITPLEMNHLVPTFGYLIEDENSAVLIASDTGPTDDVWRRVSKVQNLRAVFLEATFPNAMRSLAEVSKHLTPEMFAAETRKMNRSVRWIATHIKPRFFEQVVDELNALEIPGLEIVVPGREYVF